MSTEPRRAHAVLRAVVAPALGLTVAALSAAACKHSDPPAGGTIEQGSSREVIAPGMVAYVPPDTGAAREPEDAASAQTEDAGARVEQQAPPRTDVPLLRPPPGPPPVRDSDRVGMSNTVRPRPGPRPGARVEQPGFKGAEDKSPPAPQRVARRTRAVDDRGGSTPGIAGARRRP